MSTSGGGRGTINYSLDKPSYAYTTSTTEFDDELLKRNIVSFEQCMIAKGCTPTEARRLANLKKKEKEGETEAEVKKKVEKEEREDEESDDDDENFLAQYRKKRLQELKSQTRSALYGEVLHISRNDWSREVNEASKDGTWVIINLTTESKSTTSIQHDTTCQSVLYATQVLASKYSHVKFVSIPYTSAIENWPIENLPTIFCYRYGKLQCQLVGVEDFGGHGVNVGRVEWRLGDTLGVLKDEEDFDLETDPEPDVAHDEVKMRSGYGGGFGGVSAELATGRGTKDDYDDESDYDDVD